MFTDVIISSSNRHEVAGQLNLLVSRLSSPNTEPIRMLNWLNETKQLLSCVLIGTFDYDVAHSRIRNAIRFLESREVGAAKYEVRLLLGGLRSQLELSDSQIQSATA